MPSKAPRALPAVRRLAVVIGLVAGCVGLATDTAFAHAIVESTEPRIDQVVAASPPAVTMAFNEPVEIAFGAIRVYDTHGRRMDAGDAEHVEGRPDAVTVPLRPDLGKGTYTVTWRVVSADGHPIEEAFVFHVGEPGENPLGIADRILGGQAGSGPLVGTLAGLGRWISFAALLVLAGGAVFLVAVWRRGSVARPVDVERRFLSRWRSVMVLAWTAAVVATVVLYVVQGSIAGDLPLGEAVSPSVLAEVASTRFGLVSLVRLGLLVLAAARWFAARPRLARSEASSVGAAAAPRPLPPWTIAAGAVLALALLATPGLAGHAGTTPPVVANVAADVLHVVAAAVWVAGLLLLVVAAFPATRSLGERDRTAALAPVVARFSDFAVIAVAAVVVTGLFRSWMEVRAFRALTGATYGWTLLLKVGVFLPLLALGFVNNRWTKPRIVRAAEGDGGTAPLRMLRRLVTVEVVLVTAVLGVTAFLVNLPPARVEAGVTGPFITDVRLGANNLNLLVDPNQVGENEVHVTVTEPSGAPADIDEVRVLFRMPTEEIGPLVGRGTKLARGHFVVQGHQLSVGGEWTLEVVARTGRFDEERATVTVPVNP